MRGGGRASLRIAWDLARSLLRSPLRLARSAPAAETPDVVGRPGRSQDPLGPRFLVVSWNIHRAYDRPGVVRGLALILEELDPDLLLLQEVPLGADRGWWEEREPAALLAGWHLAWAAMHRVDRASSYYPFAASGQLIAARTPLLDAAALCLPQVSVPKLGAGHRVCRNALRAAVVAGGQKVGIANLHLENTARPAGRALQLAAALDAVPPGPSILAGDLNTAFGPAEPLHRVARRAGYRRVALAGRSRLLPALDHVLVRGLRGADGRRLPVRGSDHRPVAAVVELPDGGG